MHLLRFAPFFHWWLLAPIPLLSSPTPQTRSVLNPISISTPQSTPSTLSTPSSDCRAGFPRWEEYAELTLSCWRRGAVLHYPDQRCYTLNSRGPCPLNQTLLLVTNRFAGRTLLSVKLFVQRLRRD